MAASLRFETTKNLGATEQDRRLRKGVLGAAVSLVVAVLLVRSDAAFAWRLLLFVPFAWSANMVAMGLLGT